MRWKDRRQAGRFECPGYIGKYRRSKCSWRHTECNFGSHSKLARMRICHQQSKVRLYIFHLSPERKTLRNISSLIQNARFINCMDQIQHAIMKRSTTEYARRYVYILLNNINNMYSNPFLRVIL